MLETHTPCEYSIGSPSSHFSKRYKSLTGKLIHAATMLRESDAYGPTV